MLGAFLNTVTVTNVETLTGGATNDVVTLGAQIQGGVYDLGAGLDKLILEGSSNNTLTVANAETILGGSSADIITISGGMTGTIDLGAAPTA